MSDTVTTFVINMTGNQSGNPYQGEFKAKTLLTRRELLHADAIRRNLLGMFGANPEIAMPAMQSDAFVAGQLAVRVIESPSWFMSAGEGGIDLPDANVLEEIMRQIRIAEEARKAKFTVQADAAAEKLRAKKLE